MQVENEQPLFHRTKSSDDCKCSFNHSLEVPTLTQRRKRLNCNRISKSKILSFSDGGIALSQRHFQEYQNGKLSRSFDQSRNTRLSFNVREAENSTQLILKNNQ